MMDAVKWAALARAWRLRYGLPSTPQDRPLPTSAPAVVQALGLALDRIEALEARGPHAPADEHDEP